MHSIFTKFRDVTVVPYGSYYHYHNKIEKKLVSKKMAGTLRIFKGNPKHHF